MKRIFSCFLFQTRPADSLSAKRRAIFWIWNAVLLAGAVVLLGLSSLVLAPGYYGWVLFWDYLSHPVILILNLLPPLVLALLLYGIFGRAWLSYLITAVPVLALSFGNYYKLAFRDDPVMAADMLVLGEAGKMAGQYQLFLSTKLLCALLAALLSVLLLALFAKGRPRFPFRIAAVVIALAAAAGLTPVCLSDNIYNSNTNLEHINQWSSSQQYISRGLIYPFLHSIADAVPAAPDGYNKDTAAALLAEYEDEDIPEDKKVNFVFVMLEAFADFSSFNQIEFQQDVYATYHALEAESYSGTLMTNIFAGGTVNTERAVLTGVSSGDHNYRSNTSSYAWYLKSQGYQTSGDHPSNEWFYNRMNVNPYLGLDNYRFSENYYSALSGESTAYDYIFFPELTASVLEQIQGDAPVFSFSVSYQGHGPYGTEECWWGEVEDYIANYDLDQESRVILSNYFGSVMSTQQYLAGMVDAFRASNEPIVLVVFGDHKPWLGNNSSVYNALGIDLSLTTEESFYNYWTTSYLMWANDAAKETLGTDLVGDGPDISPCFLMNVLFDQLGWKGDAYMQAVYDCWQALPMVHTSGFYLTDEGELTRYLSDSDLALAQRFAYLEYYRKTHFDQ